MASPSLHLAVYVVGFSGHSSKNYVGCGKSCLCRQFMYNEYSEEPCSTLLQAEFDGCVINRQHVIYWGQKEATYTSEKDKQLTVNFDVFEHTLLYQDDTGLPFKGEKYEKHIFTPLKTFLNKYYFKSREEILYPEEYSAKRFAYIMNLQVAYLYVVDVSQSCPVFVEQLQLMETLISSIKKSKHHCVVLASKFDFHCKENYKKLESCASKLKVDVIQSSSRYNTNIDTTFKYLAVKSLQLKKKHITVNVLSHAECAVEKRKQSSIDDADAQKQVNIHEIPHVSVAEQPLKWSMFSRRDTTTPSDVTTACNDPSLLLDEYKSSDSFDSIDDDETYEEMENTIVVAKSSRSISDSTIELKISANDDCTKPPNTVNTFGSSQGLASTPRSSTVRMPLPKLPFESDGSIIPQGNSKNPMLNKDISAVSSLRVSESVQKGPTILPCPNRKSNALSSTPEEKKNDEGDNYININPQTHETENYDTSDNAYEEIDSADEDYIVQSPLSPIDPENKATATAEYLQIFTAPKRGTHYYEDVDFDFSGASSNVSLPPRATALPKTHTDSPNKKDKMSSGFTANMPKTKQVMSGLHEVKRSQHEEIGADSLGDNVKVLLTPSGKTASHTHTMSAGKDVPDDAAYQLDGKQIPALQSIYDDTISLTSSVNSSSKLKHSLATMQSKPDMNSSVTIQPIYCNVSVNRKSVCPPSPIANVKMYKVKPFTPDIDQLSDTDSEVYSYDYAYHRNLRLRKHGKECDGVPPRNIIRPGYTASSDYVNITTQHDYVNFKTIENSSTVSPPRSCSTGKSSAKSGKETAVKPILKQPANVRPTLPHRNIPRQGYYLSGPSAVPPNHSSL